MLEREVNGFTCGLDAGEALDPIHQSRIEDDISSICGRSTCARHGDCLYTHLMCTNPKVLSAGTQHLLSPRKLTRRNLGFMRLWILSAWIVSRCVKRLLHGAAACSNIPAAASSAPIEVLH